MKKNSIYIIISVVIGLLLGYLIFGKESSSHQHNHATTSEEVWTCSMHPQIRQSEPGECPICGMDLIPAGSMSDGLSPEQFKMTANALALANVQTTIVNGETESDDHVISLSGKITSNEEGIAVQTSYFEGRVERLHINYDGQLVQKGQLLATIYAPELVAAQQELLTAINLKESQPKLYHAVRNKLKLWKLSDKQINSIEDSGKVRENFPIYATVSGTVLELMSAEGDYLKEGQPIAKVSSLKTVWAEFDVYESQLSQFKKGQSIDIATNAYPDKTFKSKIVFIDPILNEATRTVNIRATLDNKNKLFKPGMFVSGKITPIDDSNIASKLLVPSSAVMWTGERSLVYVKVNADEPVFEMREVNLGKRVGAQIEIRSGLESGEEIVTHGTFTVDAAAQLQGKKSMMNRISTIKTETDSDKKYLPIAFQKTFLEGLSTYFEMKDALVNSNHERVIYFTNQLLESFDKADVSLLNDEQTKLFTDSRMMIEQIGSSSTIDMQRKYFITLNNSMVDLTLQLQKVAQPIYVQKCPMANENNGAIWLSLQQEVKNPYYGSMMLKCGSVIDVVE